MKNHLLSGLEDLPFSRSGIPASTIDAYLAARYTVLAGEPFSLKIDCPSAELARLLDLNQTRCAAFITAWNPSGGLTSDTENHAAQQALATEIKSRNLRYLEGAGEDPSGRWPSEPSLLVFGISLASATDLAKQFNQNAFVYADSDATPQLVLLRYKEERKP